MLMVMMMMKSTVNRDKTRLVLEMKLLYCSLQKHLQWTVELTLNIPCSSLLFFPIFGLISSSTSDDMPTAQVFHWVKWSYVLRESIHYVDKMVGMLEDDPVFGIIKLIWESRNWWHSVSLFLPPAIGWEPFGHPVGRTMTSNSWSWNYSALSLP